MKIKRLTKSALAALAALLIMTSLAAAQAPNGVPISNAFTYQGQLEQGGLPYTGTCDLQFVLYDAASGGSALGPNYSLGVSVVKGLFTVALDFGGGVFTGDERYLEISVRCPAGSGGYTLLSPRQALTASPYALHALTSGASQSAGSVPWSGITGMPAGFSDGVDNNTLYSAGSGLQMSGTSLSIDSTYTQRRVQGTCATGNSIAMINQDGSVYCEADNDTIYTSETDGLTVSGNTISLDATKWQKRVSETCAEGSAMREINSNGTVVCQSLAASTGWSLTGNAGTNPTTNYLGTSDNNALELRVNNTRTLRLEPNATSPNIVGGFAHNYAAFGVYGAFVGGGGALTLMNRVTDLYGTVAGGANNEAGGGLGDVGDSPYPTVCGGYNNWAGNSYAFVGGGNTNSSYGLASTLCGGENNWAMASYTTVGGGLENQASKPYSTVAGGNLNIAGGDHSTVSGGYSNMASGIYAVVPGGAANLAQGNYSFAAGHQAKAYNNGCFAWGDATSLDIGCSIDNQWVARTSGGANFWSDPLSTVGVWLPPGAGAWVTVSDVNQKENFETVSGRQVLENLAQIPIKSWNYKTEQDSIRHIGPTAQDFAAAFGVGVDNTHISTVDADGVALAAIQGLYAENQQLKDRVDDLEARISSLEKSGSAGVLNQTGILLAAVAVLLFGFNILNRRRGQAGGK